MTNDSIDPTEAAAEPVVVTDASVVAPEPRISEQKRAFLAYKRRVAESGKPFFPHGVWHDVVAALITLVIIIGLSTVWYAQANCDSLWNVACNRVSTPLEQEQYTPNEPGVVQKDKKGNPDATTARPILGLLYEEKADPATTSYHPRPEWYFYFLFYLLVLASNPQLVMFATIIVPTLWLVMLIAWPFIDRKKERRPSRRPVAMAAMVMTAVMLLSFTYLGSQSGKEKGGGPTGLTDSQMALKGYTDLFDTPGYFETCQSCHQLGGIGNGGPGPNLDAVGTRLKAEEILDIIANGKGGMPRRGGTTMTDEQVAQIAAFLSTLGTPALADDPATQSFGLAEFNAAEGKGDVTNGTADQAANPDAATDQTTTAPSEPDTTK